MQVKSIIVLLFALICIVLFVGLMFVAEKTAQAQEISVKGSASQAFDSGIFSSEPNAKMKKQVLEAAKLAAWKRYTSSFNSAKARSYNALETSFLSNLDKYILDHQIIDAFVDETAKSYSIVIRMSINGTAVEEMLNSNSAAGAQMGEGSYFTFLFLARQTASQAKFFDKVINMSTSDTKVLAEESISSSGGETVAGVETKTAEKTVTGGSVVKKADKLEYVTVSSMDINTAISEELTVAGFEVVDYVDVVDACGGAEPDQIATEFSQADDISRQTRKLAIAGARECDVSYFALGTLDVGMNDIDPVSGLDRVYVSVRGQVWSIVKRLPKKVVSVGPIQFAGLGPDAQVARRNALLLAGREAGSIIVDQMNMKNLR